MDFGFSAVCSEPRTEDFPVPVPNGTEGVRCGTGPYSGRPVVNNQEVAQQQQQKLMSI